jgi:hypothetical protein
MPSKNSLFYSILMVLFLGNPVLFAQGVEITITPPERSFLVGEYIWIDIDFHNGTADTLCINSFDREKHLYLINSVGVRQKSPITGGWQRPPCIPELIPGEHFIYTTDISGDFGQSSDSWPSFHLPVGEYQLHADGHLRKKEWIRKVPFRSESVRIMVMDPTVEEKQVWESFNKAYIQFFFEGNKAGADSLLAVLINQYPTSAYIVRIWDQYVRSMRYFPDYPGDRWETSLNRYMQFISRFPDDHAAKRALASLPGHPLLRKDRERLIRVLDQVIAEHPNSLVAERARSIKTKEISRAVGKRKRE